MAFMVADHGFLILALTLVEDWTHCGRDRLRKGRVSIPFGRYFITLSVRNRQSGLACPKVHASLRQTLREMHGDRDIEFICATTMPDHFHLLYGLGNRLSLWQIQAKLKAKTLASLRGAGLEWQDNFFDHHLNARLPMDRFARYIFLNPYRKQLISPEQRWPFWLVNSKHPPEFMAYLRDGCLPQPEWFAHADDAKALVDADTVTE